MRLFKQVEICIKNLKPFLDIPLTSLLKLIFAIFIFKSHAHKYIEQIDEHGLIKYDKVLARLIEILICH